MPSTLYCDLGGAGATRRACYTELNSLYRKSQIKISPLADSSAETTKVRTYATEQMVQGLEGSLVTPLWRLCEILGGSAVGSYRTRSGCVYLGTISVFGL
jgi:hypothetical protein